jgi:Galactosyltransferase
MFTPMNSTPHAPLSEELDMSPVSFHSIVNRHLYHWWGTLCSPQRQALPRAHDPGEAADCTLDDSPNMTKSSKWTQGSNLTMDNVWRSVARLNRRRKVIPILMIILGSALFLNSMFGLMRAIVMPVLRSPHDISMHAQVEWARHLRRTNAPLADPPRVDILRKPVPTTINHTDVALVHKPIAMIGVFMMDTPQAAFHRKILRLVFPGTEVILRFVICQPSAMTLLEADVVAIDMVENMNNGKTQRWFSYALANCPPSVEAVFKMDDDVLFCWNKLQYEILQSRKNKFAYYGRFIDHHECGKYFHCPPEHCNGQRRFVGDCFYYMQGGLYGFSMALLKEIHETPMFQTDQNLEWHEDIMAGQWVNQTASRASVVEVPFWPYHDKALVKVEVPKYENVVKTYGDALWRLKCVNEYINVAAELEILHKDAKLYYRLLPE